MEDLPQQTADEEKAPARERRFLKGNFLSSWLWRRDQPVELLEKHNEKDEKEGKKFKLADRIRRAFKGVFRREVSVGSVENLTLNNEPRVDNEAMAKSESVQDNQENNPAEVEGGLLPVSEDAIRRYNTEPAVELRSPTEEELQALIYERPNEQSKEQEKLKTEQVFKNQDRLEKHINRTDRNLSEEERVRRRRERKLKRQVKDLKKQTNSTAQEQKEVKKQQKEFEHTLEEQQRAAVRQEAKKPIVVDRVYNRLPAPKQETAIYNQLNYATPAETLKPNRDILPEVRKEELKQELLHASPVVRPEIIQHKVETAAEQNIAIESLYERRHEVKDEEPVNQAAQSSGAPYSLFLSKRLNRYSRNNQPQAQTQPVHIVPPASSPPNEMYTQAAKSGIFAGVTIAVLLIILLIIQ